MTRGMVPVHERQVPRCWVSVLVCNILYKAQMEATFSLKVSGNNKNGIIKLHTNALSTDCALGPVS